MFITEKKVKGILSKSGIPTIDYCLNPYVGCAHSCRYCYAEFMKKYTSHTEAWGSFVDIKINASQILIKELNRFKKGLVSLSTVTDPYQPLEAKYKITRSCLEILSEVSWPVSILTKSTLILRDIDIIKEMKDIEVGITITTDNDDIRKIFEPNVPSIDARIKILKRLKENNIATCIFIGPILPMNPLRLKEKISGLYDDLIVDRMNYSWKVRNIYNRYNLNKYLTEGYFKEVESVFLN